MLFHLFTCCLAMLSVESHGVAVLGEWEDFVARFQRREQALDNVYLEYHVWSRIHDLERDSPQRLVQNIRDGADFEWDTCWRARGEQCYWECKEVSGDQVIDHKITWFDGQVWYRYSPGGRSGLISDHPMTLAPVLPRKYFIDLDGLYLSEWMEQSPYFLCNEDSRYTTDPHVRLEFAMHAEFPPERLMVTVDESLGWTPRRVYYIRDDLLCDDYEVVEFKKLESGVVVPKVFRTTIFNYKAYGHFPVISGFFEFEAELVAYDENPSNGLQVGAMHFPSGTRVHNMFTEQTSLYGASLEIAYDDWCSRNRSVPGQPFSGNGWYWQQPGLADDAQLQRPLVPIAELTHRMCGPIALYGLLKLLDPTTDVTISGLSSLCHTAEAGTRLADLLAGATAAGRELTAIKLGGAAMPRVVGPMILLLHAKEGADSVHYVLAEPIAVSGELRWLVTGFPDYVQHLRAGERLPHWTGIAVLDGPTGERIALPSSAAASARVVGLVLGGVAVMSGVVLMLRAKVGRILEGKS